MKSYYKTSDGKVIELKKQEKLYLLNRNIVELVITDVFKEINCQHNQLTKLIIIDGCEVVKCHNNQLKELIISDKCEYVRADMKSVTELNKVDRLMLWIYF